MREDIAERQEAPPEGRKWKVAVCGPQRPAQVALGPDFTIGWDSHAADFAMTLGEFYCKGLNAPVIAALVVIAAGGLVLASTRTAQLEQLLASRVSTST